MKKIILATVFFLFLCASAVAQDISEWASINGGVAVTINEKNNPESLSKPGSLAFNKVKGEGFILLSNFQIGVFGSYQHSDKLVDKTKKYRMEGFSAGLLLRQTLGYSEIILGAGYFQNNYQYGGYFGSSTYEKRTIIDNGIIIPARIVVSHDASDLFPKISISAEQELLFTDAFSSQYFEVGATSFAIDLSVYRLNLFSEAYLSPSLGMEKGYLSENMAYKIGFAFSSSVVRADIVRAGYFFESSITGIEGFYISFNPVALFLK